MSSNGSNPSSNWPSTDGRPSTPKIPVAPKVVVAILVSLIIAVILFVWLRVLYYLRRASIAPERITADTIASSSPMRLSPEVLASLPTFIYSKEADHKEDQDKVVECAVCLMELKEGEKGRLLVRCHHRFHADCIDMWFHSHSSCPICRAAVGDDVTV